MPRNLDKYFRENTTFPNVLRKLQLERNTIKYLEMKSDQARLKRKACLY